VNRWCLLAFRDRLLASPTFQAWARRNPLTRAIARRRAAELFDLCAGFVYSQILLACVRLRLFRVLESGPYTPDYLAFKLGLTRAAMLTLLEGAAALDLVQWRRHGELCGLGKHGAALLGNPGCSP
jgi:demethylspheroidene O-methyltransferase